MNEGPIEKNTVQVATTIQALRQEMQVMGANDSEMFQIDSILESLKNGKCAPEQALKDAMTIRSGKQDYH